MDWSPVQFWILKWIQRFVDSCKLQVIRSWKVTLESCLKTDLYWLITEFWLVKEIQKNMEFSKIIFQTQKTMQFNCASWKVTEISSIDFFLWATKQEILWCNDLFWVRWFWNEQLDDGWWKISKSLEKGMQSCGIFWVCKVKTLNKFSSLAQGQNDRKTKS